MQNQNQFIRAVNDNFNLGLDYFAQNPNYVLTRISNGVDEVVLYLPRNSNRRNSILREILINNPNHIQYIHHYNYKGPSKSKLNYSEENYQKWLQILNIALENQRRLDDAIDTEELEEDEILTREMIEHYTEYGHETIDENGDVVIVF